MKKLVLFLIFSASAFAQTHTFPFTVSGTAAATPTTCSSPSFYWATDTNVLSICNAANGSTGIFTPVTSTSGGGGGNASVSINPGSIAFGTVQTGSASPPNLPATISNTSATSINVTAITIPGSDFSLTSPTQCLGILDPFSSCPFQIQAHPTSAAAKVATATITTTAPVDPQNPLTLPLSATGTGAATALITFAPFGPGGGSLSDGGSLNATFNNGICTGCSLSYAIGTVLTIVASPDAVSTVGLFSGSGITGLSPTSISLTVTQNQTIAVGFNLLATPVQVNLASTGQGIGSMISDALSTNGILSCAATAGQVTTTGAQGCFGPFLPGTIINVTPTAGLNSTFVGWTGGPTTCTTGTCQILVGTSPITLVANFAQTAATATIALIQAFTNAAVSGATVSKAFVGAQQAGDINICFCNWADATSTVSSFSDSVNGAYTQVPTISPKVGTALTQAVYYFQNIAAASAGANTVTATLSTSAASAVAGASNASAHDNGTSATYTTASSTMTTNNLILATFWAQLNSGNGPGAMLSVADTGCGLTWVLVQALNFNSTQGTGTTTRMETWRTLGNGSSCTVTGTWAQAVVGRGGSISKFSGADTTGTFGSGAIGIKATNTGSGTTAMTVTMGTFGSASNATFGVFGSGAAASRTQGAGMTLLGSDTLIADEWAAGNVSPVQQTLGASGAWGAIGIEIKASGGSSRRDLRCLEYAGIKATGGTPIDQAIAAIGTSAAPSSGGVTTGTANDLVIGGVASNQSVNTVSTSYTQQLKDTFGDDAEDRQGVPIATYPFAPALTASGNWVASQVAFLGASTSSPTTFSLTVNNNGTGSGQTTSNAGAPNINCGVSCSSVVPQNSAPTLTAQPFPGSVFDHWIGPPGCSISPTCTLPVFTSNQNVTAVYTASGQKLYYVNGSTGSDSSDGLAATVTGGHGPWRTLRHADAALTVGPSGTIVSFTPFNYGETVTLTQGGASFARIAYVCSSAWTVGGTNCKFNQINTYNVNNVDIGAQGRLGFEFTNPTATVAINDVANFCNTTSGACNVGNSIHVLGNYIHDLATGSCPSSGAILAGQHGRQQTDLQAIGNLIDNVGTGASCSTMQGIYITSPGAKIQNNVILRVAGGAIQYYDESCSGVVSNNTLLNGHYGLIIYGSNGCTPGFNTVSNNIIDNMTGAAFYNGFSSAADCSSGRNTLFSNNIINGNGTQWQQSQPTCEIRQGTITTEAAAATFVNYTGTASGNYQLKATSLAINGGTFQSVTGGQTTSAPAVDHLNVNRPQRQTIDIGAFELP